MWGGVEVEVGDGQVGAFIALWSLQVFFSLIFVMEEQEKSFENSLILYRHTRLLIHKFTQEKGRGKKINRCCFS